MAKNSSQNDHFDELDDLDELSEIKLPVISPQEEKRIKKSLQYLLYVNWGSSDVHGFEFGDSVKGRIGRWRHNAAISYCLNVETKPTWGKLSPEKEEKRVRLVQDNEAIYLTSDWFALFSDLPAKECARLPKTDQPTEHWPFSFVAYPSFGDYLNLIDLDEDRERVRKTLRDVLYSGIGSWWAERFTILGRKIESRGLVVQRGVMIGTDSLRESSLPPEGRSKE